MFATLLVPSPALYASRRAPPRYPFPGCAGLLQCRAQRALVGAEFSAPSGVLLPARGAAVAVWVWCDKSASLRVADDLAAAPATERPACGVPQAARARPQPPHSTWHTRQPPATAPLPTVSVLAPAG